MRHLANSNKSKSQADTLRNCNQKPGTVSVWDITNSVPAKVFSYFQRIKCTIWEAF